MRRHLYLLAAAALTLSACLAGPGVKAGDGPATTAADGAITLAGELSYRQRIALPPDTVVVVKLKDSSDPGSAPIAEKRLELLDRQVPIPFELTVERSRIAAAGSYSLQASFLSGTQPTWVSAPVTVEFTGNRVEVGTLMMAPVSQQSAAASWRCGGQVVDVDFDNEAAVLAIGNRRVALRQVVTASGARYEAIGDPSTSVWSKGSRLLLEVDGQHFPECVRITDGADAAVLPFHATGNEPSWRLDIDAMEMVLVTDLGATRVARPTPPVQSAAGTRSYAASGDDRPLLVRISDQTCTDSMSGMPYPNSVMVLLDGRELRGCGGDPARLIQGGEWSVIEINGAAPVADVRATLNFGGDGRLSGRGPCNNFTGSYRVTGEGLAISQLAGTMMMCEPTRMQQEREFLDVIAGVSRFELTSGGRLVLHAADGRTLQARHGDAR